MHTLGSISFLQLVKVALGIYDSDATFNPPTHTCTHLLSLAWLTKRRLLEFAVEVLPRFATM